MVDAVLKKCSALLAAVLIMATAWSLLRLPGSNLQMVTFAFLSSAALCNTTGLNERIKQCIQIVGWAATIQFLFSITANYPLIRINISALCSFLTLIAIPDKSHSTIILLTALLALSAPSGFTAALNRSLDIVFAGIVVLAVTTLCNLFVHQDESAPPAPAAPRYSIRQAAAVTAEITIGFIISLLINHKQAVWIMLTTIFILMSESSQLPAAKIVPERIVATPLGILFAGIYLATLCNIDYRWCYIVPFTGTLGFFILYLKKDYSLFTFLFMFTVSVFNDWMLGTGKSFHFAEIMFVRSLATVIGGTLVLCGKFFMLKEKTS